MNHHFPPANLQISIEEDHPILGMSAMLPLVFHHPRASFDEERLLELLRHSVSLTLDDKVSILLKIPRMTQTEINFLETLLVDEQEKIEFISRHFPDQIAVLVEVRMKELAEAVVSMARNDN